MSLRLIAIHYKNIKAHQQEIIQALILCILANYYVLYAELQAHHHFIMSVSKEYLIWLMRLLICCFKNLKISSNQRTDVLNKAPERMSGQLSYRERRQICFDSFPSAVSNYCGGFRHNLAFPKHVFKLISRVSVFGREDLQVALLSIRHN